VALRAASTVGVHGGEDERFGVPSHASAGSGVWEPRARRASSLPPQQVPQAVPMLRFTKKLG
jgi:hypothetical protein